jgi:hypothetical protein
MQAGMYLRWSVALPAMVVWSATLEGAGVLSHPWTIQRIRLSFFEKNKKLQKNQQKNNDEIQISKKKKTGKTLYIYSSSLFRLFFSVS